MKPEVPQNSQAKAKNIGTSPALRQWLSLSAILLILACVLPLFAGITRIDQAFYDRILQSQNHPAPADIIIVAIDDYSLVELGKWPWPRASHAQLLDVVQAAHPKAIGIDILFPEAEINEANAPSGDQQFANALARAKNVILPLASHSAGRGLSVATPLPLLKNEAAGLGHIHIELDPDGVARSVFLREGMNNNWWPHFALAMFDLGRKQTRKLSESDSWNNTVLHFPTPTHPASSVWYRDWQMRIPFYGPSGQFTSVPYVAVLRGEVGADFFRDKYVLIGPTATGMADAYPTPVTGNEGALSGVEINANILASLLDGRAIRSLATWQTIALNIVLVAITLLSLLWLSPRAALLTVTGLILGIILSSFLLLRIGIWYPPASAVIILILVYPLWSWRRLEAAITYLGEEFSRLDHEPQFLPEFDEQGQKRIPASGGDQLERHINSMRAAVLRVRDLKQFITDSLQSLPDATLITSTDGIVLLANPVAESYFKSIRVPKLIDALVPYLFANMSAPFTEIAGQKAAFSWWHMLDLNQTDLLTKGIEVSDPKGRDLIIKSAPCYSDQKILIAWIISIIDISEIRQAERHRDETLHFISHDMRSPQAGILALIELQRSPRTALTQEEFLQRIEKASSTTLDLAENFVQLAHAESNEYRLHTVDLKELLIDASESLWTLARAKKIKIDLIAEEEDYPVRVDRGLMTRALVNLISNALKYSPANSVVTCALSLHTQSLQDSVVCTITDQGMGISAADQEKLFSRFQRFQGRPNKTKSPSQNQATEIPQGGVGLGLVFVKTVIDRHHGQLEIQSEVGRGSCFKITLSAQNR